MIVPPIGGLGGELVARRQRSARAGRARAPGAQDRRAAPRRRAAGEAGSFGGALTEAISSLEKTQDKRRQRLAGACHAARSATRRRGRRPSRTRSWRWSSPRRFARRRPKPPRRSSTPRSDRCPNVAQHSRPGSRPRGMADRRRVRRSPAIMFIYLFLHMVSKPSYTTLVSGVDPSQTGKMTSTLSAQGISYQLQNNGTAIAVQANETAKARVALAGADLLGNTQPGFSNCSKNRASAKATSSSRSPTSARCRASSQQTIDSVQGVSGAQVELVLPSSQNQIFGENQSAASAAVLLSRHLVARPRLGARDRTARRLERPRPAAEQSHDHRRLRAAAVAGAGGAEGGDRRDGMQEAEQRYDADDGGKPRRDARRRRSAPARRRCCVREHERRPDDQGIDSNTARPAPR